MLEDILARINKNKKYKKKAALNSNSYFYPSNLEKLRKILKTYLYHAFHAKLFIISDDEQNHNIKFQDKLMILQSLINLKNMGIPPQLFEFGIYSKAVEGLFLFLLINFKPQQIFLLAYIIPITFEIFRLIDSFKNILFSFFYFYAISKFYKNKRHQIFKSL